MARPETIAEFTRVERRRQLRKPHNAPQRAPFSDYVEFVSGATGQSLGHIFGDPDFDKTIMIPFRRRFERLPI